MLMTPGPTEVPDRVRKAMSRPIHNPDIDEDFFDFYHRLENKLKKIYDTEKDVLILGGEGILGLEASIASLIDKGDEVLCMSNGIFGEGFADFVKMYGGDPVMCSSSYDESIVEEKIKMLIDEHDFTAATMVHCETPTGVLNDLEDILTDLKSDGIITIVDAVSSLGGTPVPTEDIDICIGGSQKCFSSPPGLTTLSVSDDAWEMIMDKDDQPFYSGLAVWKRSWFEDEWFPYTHLVSNLYALDESFDMILEEGLEDVYQRHEDVALLCRDLGKDIGLKLYPKDEELCSPTVTAFHVEKNAKEIQKGLKEKHDILIATSLRELKDDIIRIGHMGYNADEEKVRKTMDALKDVI